MTHLSLRVTTMMLKTQRLGMNLTGVVLTQEGGFQVVFEYFPLTPYTWWVGIGGYAMEKATDIKTMI